MSIEDNKRIVLEYFEHTSAGRIPEALSCLADDLTYWVAGDPERFPLAGTKSKPEFAELLGHLFEHMPKGVKVSPTGITAEGDRVALETTADAETATGKTYHNLFHFLFIVRDGKIHVVREYLDTLRAKEILVDR